MATSQVRQYKITFKNIKEGEIPCSNPIVKIFDIADNIVQKCEFKNNSVTFSIYEDAIAGLQGTCIQFSVLCENCGKCPQKNGKLCFCNDFNDCDPCQDCINGICVNRCPNQLCVDGKCQDCSNSGDCPGNQVCIGGKCTCPPTLPYFDDVAQRCYGCQNDGECGPCYRCIDGTCTKLNCNCDETQDKCVECVKSSDCPLPNQICKNNKCECAPGYIFDQVTQKCIVKPECTTDSDCLDPCKICVGGICTDIICPNPDEVCTNGKCGPIPCEGACNDATDCGPNCGCLNGVCVDCSTLDCDTCAQTIGCKCVSGNCEKDDSPCAQFSCDTNCGDRPDCGCVDGKCVSVDCEGISTLTKNEADCKLEYNLETTKCCECPAITLDNKLLSAQILPTSKLRLVSSVEVRKGSITTPLGILNLHRVDQDEFDDIMSNEEATQGQVRVTATYLYETLGPCVEIEGGPPCTGSPTGNFVTEEVDISPVFDVAAVGFQTLNLEINIPGRQYPTNLRILRSVTLTYTLISELTFESGCVYNQDQVIGTYTFDDLTSETDLKTSINTKTPGQDSNATYWIAKTVTSTDCRNPEARWFKAKADDDGNITAFGSVPFRKSYLTKLTPTTYTDYISQPDENTGPSDNYGELFSGYYYKVATDCACINEATAYYESTCANPGRLVFCDPQEASIEFDPCGMSFTFTDEFVTDCLPNFDYYGDNTDFVPDDAQLRYSIYVNGSTTPISGSTVIANALGVIYNLNQEFTSTELVKFIEIKWSHDNCNECTLRIDSDVEKELPTYVIDCEPSGTTDITYTITFFFPVDVTQIVVGSNTATPGSPTITLTVANTVTDMEMEITYDGCTDTVTSELNLPENCCDDLTVALTQDATNCDEDNYTFVATASPAISGSYSFSVNNVFAESNGTGLFSTPKNVGETNEPNTVKVVFTPTSTLCGTATKTINIDKTFGFVLSSVGGVNRTVCSSGATSTNIVYTVPSGVTGNVTYNITSGGDTTVAVSGPTPLTINVAGTPTQTKVLAIVSDTLVDGTGNGCASFSPEPITILFTTSPSVSGITILPTDPCEEASVSVTVNGTSGAIATVNGSNFLGAVPTSMTVGTTYTLHAGTAGNMTLNVTNVSAGSCSVPVSASTTVVVKDKPEITSVETVCETPGNPSSNIEITVLGTSGATVAVNPLTDNIILIESPSGTFTGVLDDTFNGTSISLEISLSGCEDSTTHFIDACACDEDRSIVIKLGGISTSSDSGCDGDTSTYTTTIANLNGGETYEWYLDALDTGTLLGTNSSLLYTFDQFSHNLYVRVTDNEGCTATDVIVVDGNPLPVFSLNIPDLCVDQPSNITYTITTGTVTSRIWKLDGSPVSTSLVYVYTPADTSAHDITLQITTTDGCVDSVTESTTATDCCADICTSQEVDIPDERVISFTDSDGNTYAIPGVYFFSCAGVDDPNNDASAAAIETFLNSIDTCSDGNDINVSWADSLSSPKCITLTIAGSRLIFDHITMGATGNYTFDVSGC